MTDKQKRATLFVLALDSGAMLKRLPMARIMSLVVDAKAVYVDVGRGTVVKVPV